MSKELIAVAALTVTLIGAVFAFGLRIGTLTERVETQTKQIDRLTQEIQAVNAGLIAWAAGHTDAPPRRTR